VPIPELRWCAQRSGQEPSTVTASDFPSGLMWAPQAVSELSGPRRLRHWHLYFPHCDPPRSEPVYCGKDGRGPDQSTGNPTCPPCFPAILLQNSASDSQSIDVRRLKGKFGWNSGSLPYDSARLGLLAQIGPSWFHALPLPRGATCPTEGSGSGRRSLLKYRLGIARENGGTKTSVNSGFQPFP
jgi:hypothetical protein